MTGLASSLFLVLYLAGRMLKIIDGELLLQELKV